MTTYKSIATLLLGAALTLVAIPASAQVLAHCQNYMTTVGSWNMPKDCPYGNQSVNRARTEQIVRKKKRIMK